MSPERKSIGDVAEIVFRRPNLVPKLNSSTAVEPIFFSRHIANAMLHAVLFL